jgi:hypothetical protein
MKGVVTSVQVFISHLYNTYTQMFSIDKCKYQMSRLQNIVWTPRMKTLVEMNWLDFDVWLRCHHGLNPGLRILTITSHLLVHVQYTLWYNKSHQKFYWNYALVYGLSRNLMCSFNISWVIWENTSPAGYLVSDEVHRWSWFCVNFDSGGVEGFFGLFLYFACI